MSRDEAGQLLTRYLEGDLSPGEQERLTAALLSDQDLFNAFAEETLFAELLAAPDFRAKVEAAVRPRPTGASRFAEFFKSLDAGWRWAGAAAMVALLLLTALVVYRGRHLSAPLHEPVPAVLTVLLTPTERGSAAPKIAIGDNTTVRLRMNVPQGSYTSYRVVLKAVDGAFQRDFNGLAAIQGPGVPQLLVELPASQLRPGEYTLELSGVTSAGAIEPAAGYGFSVMAR